MFILKIGALCLWRGPTCILGNCKFKNSSFICFSSNKQPQSSTENYDKIISSLSEEIQKFDSYFNEKSCNLSPYDVRQTQIVTVQIKEKFLALQDSLRPKKKFGFKSKNKKVSQMP